VKILIAMGTRPEAIKMAPVYSALKARPELSVEICLTAQHRDLLDSVINVFGLPIAHDLNIMQANQDIYGVTTRVLDGMRGVLRESKPAVVLVHGDTTTSFAAALAAYYEQAKVGHVEAGLRSFDKWRPFPEEMNRRLADQLTDYFYAPTNGARDNLVREGVDASNIFVTGNTVIDALLHVTSKPYTFTDHTLERAGRGNRLIVITAHRRESFGDAFKEMCLAMRDLVDQNPDVELVFPVHPNPNVRAAVSATIQGVPRIHLVEPMDYLAFSHLMKKSTLLLTDSGGIQEEAPALGKPVVVMREVTERPEGVAAGTSVLAGTSREKIRNTVQQLLDDPERYDRLARAANPYGDGKAAERIADHLVSVARGQRA
jgi:UDP-N-acetylglucosamine 2-epimerase (non-hydrolysing)